MATVLHPGSHMTSEAKAIVIRLDIFSLVLYPSKSGNTNAVSIGTAFEFLVSMDDWMVKMENAACTQPS